MLKHQHNAGSLRATLSLAFAFLLSGGLFAQLTVSVTGENIPCFGLSSGTATATATGGAAPYTYAWSNGGATASITNLNAGTYGVTATDTNGQTASGSVTLTQPSRVQATITDPEECEAPFMIAAEPSGGTGPYSYNWSTGADTRAVIVPAGDYCVTVVDASLCGLVVCKTIEDNPPGVTLVDVDVTCRDADDGAITANPSGGVAPYTYAWSNGATGRTITGLAPGNYRLTLTDARGCTAMASIGITEPTAITGQVVGDATVCPGATNAVIRIVPTGGTPPYRYRWSPGGFTSQAIGGQGPGTYTVTVTDANGCTLVDDFIVIESPAPEITISGNLLLCGAGSTGTLQATPASGPVSQYTYEWSTGANSPSITGVGPGNYSVTATDANGCEGTATATVRLIDLDLTLRSTPVSCANGNDGTATATATGGDQPYTYQWSNGGSTATITGLTPGVYGVTVAEENACKVSGNVQVGEPAELLLTAAPTNVTCAGDNDGSINVSVTGGIPAYTYRWSDGATTEDRNNLAAGTYALTVTDTNGCTDNITIQITSPTAINLSGVVTDLACNGDASGRIVVTASGGTPAYRYAWSNGASTRVLAGLSAGSYLLTVTDANECSLVATYTVTEPADITVGGVPTNVICTGDMNGAIDLTVSGGTPGYGYSWSNSAFTQDVSGLTAGTYTVTVTDANECSETATFTISEADGIVLSATPTNVLCNGGNDGAIDLTADGGIQAYTYLWSNGATTQDLSGLTAGTYSTTVTDANGCTETTSVSISEPRGLNGFAQITRVTCTGEATGAINLTAEFGTLPYTYAWSNGATTEDISGLSAGNYTVTVTDANNCTLVQIYMVASLNPLELTAVVDPVECNGDNTGGIDLTVSGGTGGYAYNWSNGTITQDITGVPAGDYTVTVTDANECSTVATFTVTQSDEITLSVTASNIVCGGAAGGTVTVFPQGGTAPYTYRWSNGDTGNVLNNVSAGTYSVTVTDANGCTDVTSGIVLGELPELSCSVRIDQPSTTGSNGQLTVIVDGGTIPYTYLWSNNETTATISDLSGGTYSVTATDANNCTTECTATLRALSGIGDFVWVDAIPNGQQDPGEQGLFDYPVYLKNTAGVIIDSTRTDRNGFYAFMGLEPGAYYILFVEPVGGDRTFFNMGDDGMDNDADPNMAGVTQQYTLAPGEFNMTVDAGFVVAQDGPIIDPCNCLNNNTTDLDGQFSEIVEITSGPNQTWTVIAQENMFLLESEDGTAPPFLPTPVPLGTVLNFIEVVDVDPVFGPRVKYAYEFRSVDSLQYRATISNGIQEFTIENQCFYPEVRFTELPPEEICRFDATVLLEGFARLNGLDLPGTTIFTIDGQVVTEITPMSLPAGEYVITVQFIPDPPSDEDGIGYCMPMILREFLLVDNCPAKLGDFVWQDSNGNGQQDAGEPGIEGVKVTVTSQDGTYMDMTFTDETGRYMFSVDPGTYKMTFERPEDFRATTQNSGDDAMDSDMNPTTLMTGFYTLGPDGEDFTIDAGFINPCIANVTNPGSIGFSQEVCGPGNAPEPFVELAPASGGQGAIEYLWMFNTSDPNLNIVFWEVLPNSSTPNYTAGPVSQTTYFIRCVRRNGCRYIESNMITVEVGDDAVANISGPTVICQGEEAVFQAVNPGNGAQISWNFTGPSSVESSNQPIVRTTFGSFGTFSVTLTVTANGCVSTRTQNITVINRPSRCGGNLTINGGITNLQQRDVRIEWEVPADGSGYAFQLERSLNGIDFVEVVSVDVPVFVSANGMAMYRQGDVSPLAGRNFYRVRMLDATYGDMLSNVVELQLAGASTALGRVFPNPARNGILHVEMTAVTAQAGEVSIQLYDVRGNQVAAPAFPVTGSGVINLPTMSYPAGVYFLRIVSGDRTETHRVIVD
jgi:hypothetical protein